MAGVDIGGVGAIRATLAVICEVVQGEFAYRVDNIMHVSVIADVN